MIFKNRGLEHILELIDTLSNTPPKQNINSSQEHMKHPLRYIVFQAKQ